MKNELIFDASVLVTAHISGDIFRTGIYRVSFEILKGLINSQKYTVYLFDIYNRERELRKFVAPKFVHAQILPIDDWWYKIIAYPLFDIAEYFRFKEHKSGNSILIHLHKLFKNLFQSSGNFLKYIERESKFSSDYLNFAKNGVYFSTYNKLPIDVPSLSHLKKVIIIHDLLPILKPEYFYDEQNKAIFEIIMGSIMKDDTVICVSESTKRDFLNFRPSFNSAQVLVTHLASASCFMPILSNEQKMIVKKKYNIPPNKNYFLSVCTIEPRKNIGLLISAYEKLLGQKLNKEIPILVLTGVVGWKTQSIVENIDRINNDYPGTIILTGFVSDEELAVLYSNTIAFVYPSLYEGFGLPPLEAMKCGAPVITSNNSSLPEVVGNAGILIDALDESSLVKALQNCLDDVKVKELRKNSLDRGAFFSWNATVNRIINILDQLILIQ